MSHIRCFMKHRSFGSAMTQRVGQTANASMAESIGMQMSKLNEEHLTRQDHRFDGVKDLKDWPDVTESIRKTMRANKGKDTLPELALRSLVHRLGYRFRIHVRGLPGTPDLVFPRRKKVIWMHGCFWHRHPGCRFTTVPKTRANYWLAKFARNQVLDGEHTNRLAELGWQTLVVWECEMKDDMAVTRRVETFLGPSRVVNKP
jgi:DNA mismatch endonuclease (patch repair protein)